MSKQKKDIIDIKKLIEPLDDQKKAQALGYIQGVADTIASLEGRDGNEKEYRDSSD